MYSPSPLPLHSPISPPEQLKSWASQLELIAEGNQMALAEFYDTTNSLVFRLLLRILSDHSNSEEVLLDVYLQVWHQAVNYKLERGTPITWLMTIARSRALDRLRSNRQARTRNQSIESAKDVHSLEVSPEYLVLNNEYEQIMRSALSTISLEQQQVIELAYFSGLTQIEIAEQLDLPLGTVKTRIRLGLVKLKVILRPLVMCN